MPYVTPDNTPTQTICWRVFIPDDDKAIAAFLGQMSELYDVTNWEQDSGISEQVIADLFSTVYETMKVGCKSMIGSLVHYITTTSPEDVLPCDGAQYLRVDYPDLYANLPTSLIIDADNFIVPTIEDTFLMASGVTYLPEDVGGESEHTLTIDEIPAHEHSYNYPTPIVQFNATGAPNYSIIGEPPTILNTTSVGGGQSHNNIPPFVAYKVGIVAK